jgi:hypothetical protein
MENYAFLSKIKDSYFTSLTDGEHYKTEAPFSFPKWGIQNGSAPSAG